MSLNFNHNMENKAGYTFQYTFEITIESDTRFEIEDIEKSISILRALIQGYSIDIPEKIRNSKPFLKYKHETTK